MLTAIYQGFTMRVLVKSTKTCRVTHDLQVKGTPTREDVRRSFLVPTTELKFTDPVELMVQAVKEHALKNYTDAGWDYVVETYEDKDIRELVKTCRTIDAAIRKMGSIGRLLNERRKEAESY